MKINAVVAAVLFTLTLAACGVAEDAQHGAKPGPLATKAPAVKTPAKPSTSKVNAAWCKVAGNAVGETMELTTGDPFNDAGVLFGISVGLRDSAVSGGVSGSVLTAVKALGKAGDAGIAAANAGSLAGVTTALGKVTTGMQGLTTACTSAVSGVDA